MQPADLLLERAPLVLALAALLLILGLGVWVMRLQRRVQRMLDAYQSLLQDTSGGNLEEILESHLAELQRAALTMNHLQTEQNRLDARLKRTLQHVSLVRFNPFHDTGSDQSFCMALLDGCGDGVVVSGLYARQDVRVFAKPVHNSSSVYVLTEEEVEAIRQATEGSV